MTITRATPQEVVGEAADRTAPDATLAVDFLGVTGGTMAVVTSDKADMYGEGFPGMTRRGHAFRFDIRPYQQPVGARFAIRAKSEDGSKFQISPQTSLQQATP